MTPKELQEPQLEICREVAISITGDVVAHMAKLILSKKDIHSGDMDELRDLIQAHIEELYRRLSQQEKPDV
ncbi:MAG: hypothetical protein KJ970_13285 [Candidatus Eisenbacteria bacterium]|uniref:Uncharacterized protein n=1 Tax=Eiseniibacteriota bacterium TaxID=2212470 RepID=A0A948RYF1_UNCEI|nr:hypothetical protein [Candidatus Eisenbacteria bacterium]MBU1947890.1 hypothetical protein [Candidatus Eisenbacteria bacterium]MBU2691888.1 hypothetical protein [Candidatus Eisenbacteria bacterium]